MHGFENNYNVMEWYLNNWNGQITPEQSKKDAGRYYTNHFAIAVSLSNFIYVILLLYHALS